MVESGCRCEPCAAPHDVDPAVSHLERAHREIELEGAHEVRDVAIEIARKSRERRRELLHAVRGAIGGVASGVVARRPAPSGGIIGAQLTALAQQSRIECPPPAAAQLRLVNERREERLHAYRVRQYAGAAPPGL